LRAVQERLRSKFYANEFEFMADLRLVFANYMVARPFLQPCVWLLSFAWRGTQFFFLLLISGGWGVS
jgi:hypothetical protein